MIDLGLAFEDALAQGVVQVGDLAAFVGVVDNCFAVAVLGIVFKQAKAIAGEVACRITGVADGAGAGGQGGAIGHLAQGLAETQQAVAVAGDIAGLAGAGVGDLAQGVAVPRAAGPMAGRLIAAGMKATGFHDRWAGF